MLGTLFPVGSSICAWAFSQEVEVGGRPVDTPGFCFQFSHCSLMDQANELQTNSPISLGPFSFNEWIVASAHECIDGRTQRFYVTRPALGYMLANFLPFGLYLMTVLLRKFANVTDPAPAGSTRCQRWCSARWNLQWCLMRPGTMKFAQSLLIRVATMCMVLTAAFAATIAWSNTDNVSLLPLFAVISLGMESIHTMPRVTPATPLQGLRTPACWSRWGIRVSDAAVLWLRRLGVLVGALIAPLFFGGPLVGLLAAGYGLDNPYETQAVKRIAWMDVYLTASFGLCTALGISHNHYKLPARWVARITFAFAAGLVVMGVFMERACDPSQYISPSATLETYEDCEDSIAGIAYALAFVSIMRQPFLSYLSTARCCRKRLAGQVSDSDDEESEHGHGHGHGHGHAGDKAASHAPAKGAPASAAAAAKLELSEPLIPRGDSSSASRSSGSLNSQAASSQSLPATASGKSSLTSVIVAATSSGANLHGAQ